jgi:hypothetical protein
LHFCIFIPSGSLLLFSPGIKSGMSSSVSSDYTCGVLMKSYDSAQLDGLCRCYTSTSSSYLVVFMILCVKSGDTFPVLLCDLVCAVIVIFFLTDLSEGKHPSLVSDVFHFSM